MIQRRLMVVVLFGALILPLAVIQSHNGHDDRQTPTLWQRVKGIVWNYGSKHFPFTRREELISRPKRSHVSPDSSTLTASDSSLASLNLLCPLFPTLKKAPTIRMFNQERRFFESRYVDKSVWKSKQACSIDLGVSNGLTRHLIQLDAVNQVTLTPSAEHCPTLALRSALMLQSFFETNNKNAIASLNDDSSARNFIDENGCARTATPEMMLAWMHSMFDRTELDSIAVLETPIYLDPVLMAREPFSYTFSDAEGQEISHRLNAIKADLRGWQQKPRFFYAFILGTADEAFNGEGAHQHWYTFAILKQGDFVNYVVVETNPEMHLIKGSYNLERLRYFIDLLEAGSSSIQLIKHQ